MESIQNRHIDASKFSDIEVVEHVLGGEKQMFEILLRRYNQRIYRVIRSYIKSDAETQDIMQEAYVKAYTKLDQFKNQAAFSTWLIRIAINEALQEIRKKKRSLTDGDATEKLGILTNFSGRSALNPENQTIVAETKRLIETAVDKLPEKYRMIYMLQQVEGLSNTEIATCLDITDSNVKVRLHRAKTLIKEDIFKFTHDASIFEFGNLKCDLMVMNVMKRI
jgi:RNA polymerase sigma-70 factor (ECF subfamily)